MLLKFICCTKKNFSIFTLGTFISYYEKHNATKKLPTPDEFLKSAPEIK